MSVFPGSGRHNLAGRVVEGQPHPGVVELEIMLGPTWFLIQVANDEA